MSESECFFEADYGSVGFCWRHVHASPVAIEIHGSLAQCEERVVTAEPYIFARVPFGSALTSKDIAGQNCLTAEFLNPAALCG